MVYHCSSSRSIKRRKFDDELVESSLSTPVVSGAAKPNRVRTTSSTASYLGKLYWHIINLFLITSFRKFCKFENHFYISRFNILEMLSIINACIRNNSLLHFEAILNDT